MVKSRYHYKMHHVTDHICIASHWCTIPPKLRFTAIAVRDPFALIILFTACKITRTAFIFTVPNEVKIPAVWEISAAASTLSWSTLPTLCTGAGGSTSRLGAPGKIIW